MIKSRQSVVYKHKPWALPTPARALSALDPWFRGRRWRAGRSAEALLEESKAQEAWAIASSTLALRGLCLTITAKASVEGGEGGRMRFCAGCYLRLRTLGRSVFMGFQPIPGWEKGFC